MCTILSFRKWRDSPLPWLFRLKIYVPKPGFTYNGDVYKLPISFLCINGIQMFKLKPHVSLYMHKLTFPEYIWHTIFCNEISLWQCHKKPGNVMKMKRQLWNFKSLIFTFTYPTKRIIITVGHLLHSLPPSFLYLFLNKLHHCLTLLSLIMSGQ